MFAGALFFLTVLTIVSGSVLCAGYAMTRASMHHMVRVALAASEAHAEQQLVSVLRSAMQNGQLPSPLPTIGPLHVCVEDPGACTYEAIESITLAPATAAQNEQRNNYAAEGRIAARIAVTIQTRVGERVANETRTLVVRTLETPPYIVLAGQTDDGGIVSVVDACAPQNVGSSDDTAVHVVYLAAGSCRTADSWATPAPSAPPQADWSS